MVIAVDDLTNMYGLNDLFGAVLGYMTQLFNIYTTTWILTGMLAIWLLRRVVRLFKRL